MTQALVQRFKQERPCPRSKGTTGFDSGRSRGRPAKLKYSENRIMNYPPSKQPKSSNESKTYKSRSAAAARASEAKHIVAPPTQEQEVDKKAKRHGQAIVRDPPNESRNKARNGSRNGSLNKFRHEYLVKSRYECAGEFRNGSQNYLHDEFQDETAEETFERMLERKVPDVMLNELEDGEYVDLGVYERILVEKKNCTCDACKGETAEDPKKTSPKRK